MSVVGSGNHNESVKETGELGISVVQFPNFKNFFKAGRIMHNMTSYECQF